VLKPGLSVGLTVKALYEKIHVEDAWGMGGDLGVVLDTGFQGVRLGGVVQNIGQTAELKDEKIDLPLTARVGASLPASRWGGDWLIAVDGVQAKDMPFHLHSGVEYKALQRFSLRGGIMTGYEVHSWTGGIGILFKRYRADYSYMPFRSGLGDSHRLSIAFDW
jgi:hypothetical protein